MRNNRGEITGFRGVIVDISSQKKVENELREAEAFSTSLFRNSPNPILLINPDHTVLRVNPAFEKLLTGYANEEIAGMKSPYPWWPPGKYEEYKKRILNYDDITNVDRERYYRKKNGEIFWVMMTMRRVVDKGELRYLIADWVEITRRKKVAERSNIKRCWWTTSLMPSFPQG